MGGMGSLTYTLKIKSGDAWVFADDSGTTKVEVKINNWEIPFTVPIGECDRLRDYYVVADWTDHRDFISPCRIR
jgi:hypothetical protein